MNKKTLTLTIAIIATVTLSIVAYFLTTSYLSNYKYSVSLPPEMQEEGDVTANDTEESEKPHATAIESNVASDKEERPIIFTQAQMAYDPSDTKVLVDDRENIFIAKVLTRNGNYKMADFEYPMFTTETLSNLSGETNGSLTLVQGDFYYQGKYIFITEGDVSRPDDVKEKDLLLQTGSTYLFLSSDSNHDGIYGVGAYPYDRVLISSDPNISTDAAIELAKQNPRVQEIIAEVSRQGDLNEDWR